MKLAFIVQMDTAGKFHCTQISFLRCSQGNWVTHVLSQSFEFFKVQSLLYCVPSFNNVHQTYIILNQYLEKLFNSRLPIVLYSFLVIVFLFF